MLTNGSLAGTISDTGMTGGIRIWDTVVTGSVGLTVNRAPDPAVMSRNSITGRLSYRDNQAGPDQQRAAPKRPGSGLGAPHAPLADPTEGRGRPASRGTPFPGRGLSGSRCSATPYLPWRRQQ
jgi:hypothetical protein